MLDQYGNVTQSAIYPFNNTTTPLKVFNNTYLTASGYVSNYVRDRLAGTTVTVGGVTKTLVTNTYTPNYYSIAGYLPQGPTNFINSSPPIPMAYRGLLSGSVTPAKTYSTQYYAWGSVYNSSDSDGHVTILSADPATNYAAPQSVSTESYSQTMTYTSALSVSSATGQNSEQMSMGYDAYLRPTAGTNYYGGSSSASYRHDGALPLWQTTNGPTGATTATLDGVGHTIRADQQGASVDTVYAPCACSPMGKVQKVSRPYMVGQSAANWTIYTYDGLGRTLTVKQPDGASTTTYSYSGNQTTVTDPAGKWKRFTSDAEGNLATVTEPDPANAPGGTLTTTYTYDWMKHLVGVSMPRGSVTQTRTFVYDDGGRLTSATNPENGAVTYTYNADNTLASKHDAKGQDTVYSYDSTKRVTQISRYPYGQSYTEDVCARVTYAWDTNPYDSTFSQYTQKRLAAVQYKSCAGQSAGAAPTTFTEMYSYNAPGQKTKKRVHVMRDTVDDDGNPVQATADLDVSATYDSTGRRATLSYPLRAGEVTGGFTLQYGYDSMSRPVSAIDPDWSHGYDGNSQFVWVQNTTYDFAGRMTSKDVYQDSNSYWGTPVYERLGAAYDAYGRMTSQSWATQQQDYSPYAGTVSYGYSGTQDNGQIVSSTDGFTGETISYQYDALKRLTQAVSAPVSGTTPAGWTQTYGYDGFGNLTGKTLNGVTTAIAVNAATNRLTNAVYDAVGNMTSGNGLTIAYDEGNRVVSATAVSGGTEYYGYDASNRRGYKRSATADNYGNREEFTLYGLDGERLQKYSLVGLTYTPGYGYFGNGQYVWVAASWTYQKVAKSTAVWFGGKLEWENGPLHTDRLGTAHAGTRVRPYGEEVTSTWNDRVKFGSYTRDGFTGLDYADQRFYASTYGRFNTADPYMASGGPGDTGSWNRYSYVGGDPVNFRDSRGLFKEGPASPDPWPGDLGPGDGGAGDPNFCQERDHMDDPACNVGDGSGGSQAGTGRLIAITADPRGSVDNGIIKGTLGDLLSALKRDPQCLSWLASGSMHGNTSDFAKRVGSISIGSGVFLDAQGTNTSVVAALSPLSSYNIAINANGAFFTTNTGVGYGVPSYIAPNTDIGRQFILLHEFAHYFGASGFTQNDGDSNDLEAKNNTLILQKCGDVLSGGLIN